MREVSEQGVEPIRRPYGDLHGKALFDGDRTELATVLLFPRGPGVHRMEPPLHGRAVRPFFPYDEFRGKPVL
jgi:hypothetical protein